MIAIASILLRLVALLRAVQCLRRLDRRLAVTLQLLLVAMSAHAVGAWISAARGDDAGLFDLRLADTPALLISGLALFVVLGLERIEGAEGDHARSQSALADREARLSAVLDTAVEAIITIDRAGAVSSFNKAAEGMFGYTADEVIGRNVNVLMPAPYHDEHDGYIERYLRTGEARIIGIGREVTARRKDGSTFPIELAVSEIDTLQMFTGIIRDVSERKNAEARLRQADRLSSIGTLAAGLGHDMNNLLLPVRARLDIIDNAPLTDDVREQFVEIRRSAQYLQNLADGLHLLALDPDDLDASAETTDLTEWWRQTCTLLGRALPKHVHFSASIPNDLPPIGIAPHRMTQAILNLLVNSAKAVGSDGRVRLWAEVDPATRIVRVMVRDNGTGMPEEVRRRAVEPFFTTKKRGLGTGLGLSLVHGVALSAGGTLGIESTPGEGTTMILRFPAVQDRQDHPADASAPPLTASVSVRDRRTESLCINLLEMAGIDVSSNGVLGIASTAGASSLWVTDGQDIAPDDLRGQLDRHEHIIKLGPTPDTWTDAGVAAEVIVVENPNDFEALRAAIGRIAEETTP